MVKYTIEKKIAVIEDRGNETVELNYIKWGSNPAKYDLRRWDENGEPLKGITLSEEGLEELYWALSEELGYGSGEDDIEVPFGSPDEDDDDDDYTEEYDDEDGEEDDEYADEEDDDENDDEVRTIDYRSFFVLKSMRECDQKGHDYRDVVATVPIMIDDKFTNFEFPAVYCQDCNVYYVTERIYNDLKKRGKVLCQMLTEDEYRRFLSGHDFYDLNPKGPLCLLGYTTKRDKYGKDILTSAERKHLLDWIIDNGIMDKKKVLFYLDTFIKKGQGNTSMSVAVQKWKEDKAYLTGVKSEGKNAPPMGVARFVRKES